MTRRNRRFLKKIISTLAEKDATMREEKKGGDAENVLRRSTRLVEKIKKSNDGDAQKGGDARVERSEEGGDKH